MRYEDVPRARRLVLCSPDDFPNRDNFLEDFIGCGGPEERASIAVVISDEGVGLRNRLFGTREWIAMDFALRQDPGPTLDPIEPRHVGWREENWTEFPGCD